MPRALLTRSAAALTSLALVASAAVASDTAAAAGVPVGRAALRVYATNTHVAVSPDSVRPGIVHIRNIGRDVEVVLQPKRPGATARTAARELGLKTPQPLLKDFRFVGEAVPALDSYVRITKGKLLFADVVNRRVTADKISTTVVEGSRTDARVPASRRVVVTRHKKLHVPYVLPRRTWLHVLNRSAALSSFLFVGVAKKTTYKMLHDAVEHPSLIKVFRLISLDLVGLSDAGPHSGSWQQFHGVPGRYLAVVLVFTDRSQGMLHHGQVRILHVK